MNKLKVGDRVIDLRHKHPIIGYLKGVVTEVIPDDCFYVHLDNHKLPWIYFQEAEEYMEIDVQYYREQRFKQLLDE